MFCMIFQVTSLPVLVSRLLLYNTRTKITAFVLLNFELLLPDVQIDRLSSSDLIFGSTGHCTSSAMIV